MGRYDTFSVLVPKHDNRKVGGEVPSRKEVLPSLSGSANDHHGSSKKV